MFLYYALQRSLEIAYSMTLNDKNSTALNCLTTVDDVLCYQKLLAVISRVFADNLKKTLTVPSIEPQLTRHYFVLMVRTDDSFILFIYVFTLKSRPKFHRSLPTSNRTLVILLLKRSCPAARDSESGRFFAVLVLRITSARKNLRNASNVPKDTTSRFLDL